MKILKKKNHLCVLYVRTRTQLITFWTPVIPNENINKYSSLSKKMREIFIPVVHTINRKTWCRARVWSIKAGKISKNRNKRTSDQEHEKNCIVPERKEIRAVCALTPRLFSHSTLMHQSIPAAPSPLPPPPPGWPPGISNFFELDGKFPGVGTLKLSNPPGRRRKKRANAPSLVNTTTFFFDRTVEWCLLRHFYARFFVSINVFLCNSAILIKSSCRDDTSLWF